MSQSDPGMYKPFLWVLGALVLFTFIIAVLANMYSPKADSSADPLVQQSLKQQISPVGQSRVEPASETEAVSETQSAVESASSDTAAVAEATSTTESAVAATTGVVAATVAGVAAVVASTDTEAADTDTSATDDMSDEATAGVVMDTPEIPINVRAVVATNCAGCHQEGVRGAPRNDDAAAWSALADKGVETLTQSVIDGKGAMMPRAETRLSDAELELAVRHMLALNVAADSAAAVVAQEPVAVVESEEASEEVSEESAAVATTEAAVSSQASVIPDNVKGVVDSLCASCHISGVANAPKYGDKAAWDQRLSVGIDKVLASAITGKGAMPPRGGSQLSDAELRLAIEYMASK